MLGASAPCKVCSPCGAKRSAARMANFFACEPFFRPNGCGPAGPKVLSPMAMLHDACGHGSVRKVKRADGAVFIELYPGGPVVPWDSDLGTDCAIYGPHANCSRRDGDISPSDALAISEAYADETVTMDMMPLPNNPNWWTGVLGALGVSHIFCLLEATITYTRGTAAPVPIVPSQLGVAGARIVCASPVVLDDSIAYAEGAYQWAVDRPCKAKPGFDITQWRCRCEPPPCAATPSGTVFGGQEFYLADFTGSGYVWAPGDIVQIRARIARCDWLLCVDPGVCPLENRLPFTAFLTPPGLPYRRLTPGIVRPFV